MADFQEAVAAATLEPSRSREVCDCRDNDGDGYVDEDLDCTYEVAIDMAADDVFDLYFDGALQGSGGGWNQQYTFTTSASHGTHHVAVAAQDTHEVVAGLLATVSVAGTVEYVTGGGDWRVSTSNPGPGWETSTAGMSATDLASACTSYWSGAHGNLLSAGAQWVWSEACTAPSQYPENYYVLEMQVCPGKAVEICNGVDDDGDGLIDEGFPDTDGDGIADCVDIEECDCQDNDGDGYIDENLDCAYDIDVELAADDAFDLYIDGALQGSGGGWDSAYQFGQSGLAPGVHHIAVAARDTCQIVAGFLSTVRVNGDLVHVTGDGSWQVATSHPGPGWQTSTAGMSATVPASACASYWPGAHAGMLADGAEWVWSESCLAPTQHPENYYVLELALCPETAVEECGNCIDDDGDGGIDEGCNELCPVEPEPVPIEPAAALSR